jgi:uncharacterized protein YjbI with pentapeptide repeats
MYMMNVISPSSHSRIARAPQVIGDMGYLPPKTATFTPQGFSESNFENIKLKTANFQGQNLKNVNFRSADLQYANFRSADLTGADFAGANLERADFTGAILHRANFTDANLQKATFSNANLSKTILEKANLDGAFLSHTIMKEANLKGASLIGAHLNEAILDQTNLETANLSKAYLIQTSLQKANLTAVNLCGTWLTGANLEKAILHQAYYNSKTGFDADFDPKATGMLFISLENIADLLTIFNTLSQLSCRYLGQSIIHKYWQNSRPSFPWLEQFQIDSRSQFTFTGNLETPLTISDIKQAQTWMNIFIRECSQILKGFSELIAQENLADVLKNIP